MSPELDVWDAWPLADPAGVPISWRGGELWFALAVSRADDPEARHHLARIHHFHRVESHFKHIGRTLPEALSPGAREWSGSARYENGKVTLFFTATGHKGDSSLSYHQRLFLAQTTLAPDGEFGEWTQPIEFLEADGETYRPANENQGEPGKIKAFRDPSHYRDREGQDYVLFTGSSASSPGTHDGVIGLAKASGGPDYQLLPPLVEAIGVNNELERPHIVEHAGRLYLFWSTQRGVFAPGIEAPTGLYGATAERLDGPWTFLNGHGLVIGNPVDQPTQAYSWWVLPDLTVTSFVDYWGPENPDVTEEETRRARFGGTFAPFVQIALDGDKARLVEG
ncbi:levansucrase [Erythrobacter litoralis HTCC2594]|uniref:Levansucrase n=2 Tax=Erythrobacter litoralis TaxID=39960 RepID=Q2NBK2_ERYLH|nr:levansucrase [Erythrobacter litoralis HTCC2594]